jgi:ribonuclease J
MRACIHRGTKEIGGTCVEIESQGQRIVLDVGLPLDAADPESFPLHPIKGFHSPDPNLLGVVISHPHQDHYGLAHQLPKETLFLIGNGRKGMLFQKLLRLPPEHVDVLLMEGTTIGRLDTASGFPTEIELENRFVELFKRTPGMPLVWCSGQNIDRIVTVFRACKKAGRQFIVDMYAAHILRATGNKRLPQAGWDGIKVFLPKNQKCQIIRKKEFELADSYKASRIYPERLSDEASHSVMLFRPSMMRDVEEAACLSGSRLICSVWAGYLKNEKNKPLPDWLDRHSIPMDECHTSGHAAVRDLAKMRQVFIRAPVVPIHSNQPDRFEELFGNVRRRADGEWWEVCAGQGSQK